MNIQINFEQILENYRSLWNNRKLSQIGSAEDTLKEAILRELLDENSHPRIRRSIYDKYFLSSKRILESSLLNEEKLILLNLHKEILENHVK